MFYPQFDMCPPPEPFFSRAGGRKRSWVQIIGFLGLHAVTPHELLEVVNRLTQSSTTLKTPEVQKTSPELISETVNPNLVKSAMDAD